MKEYIIQSKSGAHFSIHAGKTIKIVDLEGKQVTDFFAVCTRNSDEILSPAVTIDCNESFSLTKNDYIILQAQMNVEVFIAACSVSESDCNVGKCTSLKVCIE